MWLFNLEIKQINRALLYVFGFSMAFERAYPFLPSVSYPKAVAILYLGSLLCNPNYLAALQRFRIPNLVFLLLWLFVVTNFLNGGLLEYGIKKIDTSFLLNILLVWFLLVHEKLDSGILLRSLVFFLIGYLFLVLFYNLGFYKVNEFGGRVSMGAALPNSLGFFGVFAFGILFSLTSDKKLGSLLLKFFKGISGILIMLLILATGSRSALLALLLVIAIYLFCNKRNARLSFVFISILVIPLIYASLGMIGERFFLTASTGDLGGRLPTYFFVTDLILNNLIFGVGTAQYDSLAEQTLGYSPSPHNVFLEVLAYGGLTALILWLFVCFKLIKVSLKEYKDIGTYKSLILLPPILLMGVSGQIFNNTLVFLVFAVIISNQTFLQNE